MLKYKAIESFYDYDGNLIEKLCGFGEVKDLAEARNTYNSSVKIYEISAEELAILRKEVSCF